MLADALIAICTLFQFSQRYTAALKAYGEMYGDRSSGNDFLDISQETIWRQLLSELSKLYDAEKTKRNVNCSFRRIKSLYFDSNRQLCKEKNDSIINRIDELQHRYEKLLTKQLRNKKLAHYDFEKVYEQVSQTLSFAEVEQFVKDTGEVLEKLCEQNYISGLLLEYDELVKKYKESLTSLQ